MQSRNVIRWAVAITATGALAIAVSMFHTGGDLQTAGNLVRASLAVLALLIASLSLEIGRAVDTLATAATGQAARFQGYEDQIERDAEHVRKLWIVWQVVAWLLILPTAVLVWYFHNSVTTFLFGTPDTRFMMSRWRDGFGAILGGWALLAAIEPVRFGVLLLVAKDCPVAGARVASRQDTAFYDDERDLYIPMSRIGYFRAFFALLAACLLANVIPAVSYVRVADRGIGFVGSLAATEEFHPWADVCSITETRWIEREDNDTCPVHTYTIRFSDGSEWKSDCIRDNSSHILAWDPRVAIEFAADRANLPIKSVVKD